MTYRKTGFCLCAVLAWYVSLTAASAQQLTLQQIKDMSLSICNTVKEAKGQKSDSQIQGDVKAQLNGLIGKVVDIGGSGKAALDREEFEGLSRDATAIALEGDRNCRERVFNKMFDQLSVTPLPPELLDKSPVGPSKDGSSVQPKAEPTSRLPNVASVSSFNIRSGPSEQARMITRALESEFQRAGFVLDSNRPTVIYNIEVEARTVGRRLDGPDRVIVTIANHWTDPRLARPTERIEREYDWGDPNSSANNVAEKIFEILLPLLRG